MAIPHYPVELDQRFMVNGFRTTRTDRRVEAQPARGRAWTRKGPSRLGGRPISGTIVEPIGNVARFWRFYNEELEEGTKLFLAWNPQTYGRNVSDEEGNFITDEDGNEIVMVGYCVCKFLSVANEVPFAEPMWQLAYELLVVAE